MMPDDVRIDRARALLRDDERLAVRREGDLRRARATCSERLRRTGERRQLAVLDAEARDVPRAACVQDVEDVMVKCEADRPNAARGDRGLPLEPVVLHLEVGDRVASGIDGEQLVAALAEDDRSLRAHVGSGSAPTGGEGPVRCERAVGRAGKDGDGVSAGRVRQGVDRADAMIACRGSGGGDGEQQRGARQEQRNNPSMHDESSCETGRGRIPPRTSSQTRETCRRYTKSVRSGSRSPRRTARSTSTQRISRASASTTDCGLKRCAASTPRVAASAGSRRMRSR